MSGRQNPLVDFCGHFDGIRLAQCCQKFRCWLGERFVVVTAYNAAGLESPPSNELDLQGDPPAPPEGFHAKPSADGMQVSAHFPGRGVVVEESDDLKTWRELAEGFGWVVAAVEQNKRGFFRYSLN